VHSLSMRGGSSLPPLLLLLLLSTFMLDIRLSSIPGGDSWTSAKTSSDIMVPMDPYFPAGLSLSCHPLLVHNLKHQGGRNRGRSIRVWKGREGKKK
jgi:hypothetical protein